jgi:membrane protein implicated in regulation of membrane protease activity
MENFKDWLKPELIWFVLGFVFFLLEFAIPGLIVLFFGIGAWVVALICLIADPSLNVQLIVFIITSLLSILILRKWLQTRFFGFSGSDMSTDVELDDFSGKKAVVTVAISSENAGKVEFRGTQWKAESDKEIPEGATVTITKKDNLTLKVE